MHTRVLVHSSLPPTPLQQKAEEIVWKINGCQSEQATASGRPSFRKMQITQRRIKKAVKTLVTFDNCLSQAAFSFQLTILKINGFHTHAICCQD